MVFMTRPEVESMLRREKQKASASFIGLDMKPSYATEIVVKLYSMIYLSTVSFNGIRGNTRELLFASSTL